MGRSIRAAIVGCDPAHHRTAGSGVLKHTLHVVGELCDELRNRIALHEEITKLLALRDLKIYGLVQRFRRKIDRAYKGFGAGRKIHMILVAVEREDGKLPSRS